MELVLALRNTVVLPKLVSTIFVGRSFSLAAIEKALLSNSELIAVMQKNMETEVPTFRDLYEVGCRVKILQVAKLPDGNMRILIEGMNRVRIRDAYLDPKENVIYATVENIRENYKIGKKTIAYIRKIKERFAEYVRYSSKLPFEIVAHIFTNESIEVFDLVVAHLPISVEEKQQFLEITRPLQRAAKCLEFLERELEIAKLSVQIDNEVREKIDKAHKEYYLREQLKVIKEKLSKLTGEVDLEKKGLLEKIDELPIKKEYKEKLKKEAKRLETMPSYSAEKAVLETYFDNIFEIPWGKYKKEIIDIEKTRKILDEEHWGLEKPKERILEFLAVKKLSKNKTNMKSPIICFVGPPGVGKTSLAMSIAKALNKKLMRMSVGGINDEAEIKGHIRTYVGAMPGKIIKMLQQAKILNPVILIDEVDKMMKKFSDPSAALLEVLDPQLNHEFVDHYIEIPVDLSKVFFITTANTTDTIPAPLLDRMEVIYIDSYTNIEKFHIAKVHLIKKQQKENGLLDYKIKFDDDAINYIIKYYTMEAGVRGLEKQIAKIFRKIALDILKNKLNREKEIIVDIAKVKEYLGPEKYIDFDELGQPEVGKVWGLAWTVFGGDVLPIEVVSYDGKGEVKVTGSVGEVMQESIEAALSYIRANLKKLKIKKQIFEKKDLHFHFPENAVKKDGPSAGIAILTAAISVLTNKKVDSKVAMTGEINLRGKVLPVGGIKEKLIGAYRFGIKKVYLPYKNKSDLEDVPKEVKDNMEIILVKEVEEVWKEVII